jgi:hypothetical protein
MKSGRGPKEFSVRTQEHRSTVLSGDLQGLSRTPGADSESVSELVEEGNPFEAEIVNAVEAADDTTKEVRTSRLGIFRYLREAISGSAGPGTNFVACRMRR